MARQKKTKRQVKKGRWYFFLLGAFLVIVFSVQMVRLYQKNQEYIKQEEALKNQVQQLEEEQEELQQEEEYVESDEYKEKVAREKMNMVKPGEIVFREE